MAISKEKKNEIIAQYARHRRNLLAYLRRTDVNRYRELISSLGLRR